MADRSKIEWTDATWNPVRARALLRTMAGPRAGHPGWHCTHVSEGCRNCYAETINKRLGTGLDYKPGHEKHLSIFLDEKMLTQPLRWRALKQRSGSATITVPRKIFVGSMTDLFADFVTDQMLDRVFAVMALAQQHTFQILTKRPERMRAYLSGHSAMNAIHYVALKFDAWPSYTENAHERALENIDLARFGGIPLPNVWLGTSCEDQATADDRIPHLLATPASIRFLSVEPLLGLINLRRINVTGNMGLGWFDCLAGYRELTHRHSDLDGRVDQVICGGESGPHARPMHPDWARSLGDQCAAAGVPFFFKQWGEWAPERAGERAAYMITAPHAHGGDTSFVEWPKMQRFGKARAGRLLDGVEHKGFPTP